MIWCLGMYASGSTWLFNAARQTAIAQGQPNVEGRFADHLDRLKQFSPAALKFVKTHDLAQPEANFIASHCSKILITIRDPRDAVVSLMQHMHEKFPGALKKVERTAQFCSYFANDKRAELFRYESGFTDDIATFDRLATILGGPVNPAAREKLFAQTRRAAIEAQIAQLEQSPNFMRDKKSGDIHDMDTNWHGHHAGRSGEIGRWRRMLSPEAARGIEQRMSSFMTHFGYLP